MTVKKEQENAQLPPDNTKSPAELKEEKAKATKRQTEIARVSAWSIHRAPLIKGLASQYLGRRKGKIILPKSYRSADGQDVKPIRPDEDLNRLVYNWYQEPFEEDGSRGVNFVTKDGVINRRHEYLGPDPRVAGYEIGTDGYIHIRWWDGFLENQWIDKENWKLELVQSADGEWVLE